MMEYTTTWFPAALKYSHNNVVGELAKYLNLLGGIYILDCLPEHRIYDKILVKTYELARTQPRI